MACCMGLCDHERRATAANCSFRIWCGEYGPGPKSPIREAPRPKRIELGLVTGTGVLNEVADNAASGAIVAAVAAKLVSPKSIASKCILGTCCSGNMLGALAGT